MATATAVVLGFTSEGERALPSPPRKQKNGLPVLPRIVPLVLSSCRIDTDPRARICIAPLAEPRAGEPPPFFFLPPPLPLFRTSSGAGAGLLPDGQEQDRFAEKGKRTS